MPYIDNASRTRLEQGGPVNTAGELTYLIYKAAKYLDYDAAKAEIRTQINRYLKPIKEPRYADYCIVIGALSASVHELDRRGYGASGDCVADALLDFYVNVVGPYENKAIEKNDDV